MHRPDVCVAIVLIDAGESESSGGCRGGDVCRLREREEGGRGGKRRKKKRMRRWVQRKKRKMHRMKRLHKTKRLQRRRRKRRKMKMVMSRTGLYALGVNYCFPAFGSTLKIDDSLPSINVHLPHQLTAYTDQFLLSLPSPYPFPPHPMRLSSSSSRRLVTWSPSSNQIICPS